MGSRPSCAEISKRLAQLEKENLRLQRSNTRLKNRAAFYKDALAEIAAEEKDSARRLRAVVRERNRQSKAFEDFRRRRQTLFDSCGHPMGIYDAEGVALMMNDAGAANLGGRPSDFIGRSLRELFPDQAEVYIERIRKVLPACASEPKDEVYEDEVHLPAGRRWFSSTYKAVSDKAGGVLGVQIISLDITDKKLTQSALRASEEKFKAFVQSSSEHIFLLAPDGTYLMSNDRTDHFNLPSGAGLAGKHLGEVYPADVADVYLENLRQVLEKGQPVDFEHDLDGSGGRIHHLDTLFPVFKGGGVWCVGGICRDITRLKQAERQLKESEQRYRGLIRDMPNPVVHLRPDGVLTFVNESYCRIFGASAEEFIGRAIWDKIPAEDHDRVRRHFESLVSRKSVGEIVERLVLPTGEMRWFQWLDRPFLDAEGEVTEIQGIGWDVTEVRRAHEALTLYAERLNLLRGVEREILQVKTPEEIAAGAVRRMRRLIPCRRASIQVLDPESGESELLALESERPSRLAPGTRYPAGFLDAADTLRRGQIYSVADLDAVETPTALENALRAEGIRAFTCIPLLAQGVYFGSVNFEFGAPTTFGPDRIEIALEAAGSIAIGIQNARLYQASEGQRRQLQELARRLTEAEETQCRRISQELHDRLGPNLTALSVNLGLLANLAGFGRVEEVAARLLDSQNLVAETARQTRNLMDELRPPALDDYGVVAAVAALAGSFQARTGIDVEVIQSEKLPSLDPVTEMTLFRVVQESLTNVVKHARATIVRVGFSFSSARVRVSVADDGEGFEPASALPLKAISGRGLVSMQERVSALGGRFELHASPGEGTRVEIEIPIVR
jgi:PAS domain S-box-containing protein